MDPTEKLPIEICRKIYSYLSAEDAWNLFRVSRTWRAYANDDVLWKRHCLHDEIEVEKGLTKDDGDADLCPHARIWGSWRWGTVYNWENNQFLEKEIIPSIMAATNVDAYDDKIAISDGTQVMVFTRHNSEILNIHEKFHGHAKIRDITINGEFLVVVLQTNVHVYRIADFMLHVVLGFNGSVPTITMGEPSRSFEESCVEFVFLHGSTLWMSRYLFLKCAVIFDLETRNYRYIYFPWKCTLLSSNENVIARSATQLAVYSVGGEKSFELPCLEYSWINTSKSVLALITDHNVETYDRISGAKLRQLNKSFFEFDVNYKQDLIYGISKTLDNAKILLEAVSLLSADVLWSVKLFGEYTSEVRPFLNRYLCYHCRHAEYWSILDAKSGNCLYTNTVPLSTGGIIHVSDLFWVYKNQYKVVLRFY